MELKFKYKMFFAFTKCVTLAEQVYPVESYLGPNTFFYFFYRYTIELHNTYPNNFV